jgi:hemolysin D
MPNSLNKEVINEPYETDDWSDVTQELLDSLPRVWTRGLLYLLFIFVSILLPWMMLFKVDETGTARGRLEPQGKTVRLDTIVTGTVSEVLVKEGDTVKAGQSLLILDSKLIDADLQQMEEKLNGQLKQLSQLKLLQNQFLLALSTQQQQNKAQELEKQAQIDQTQQNIQALINSSTFQKEEKLAQLNQVQQTLKQSENASQSSKKGLVSAQREVERYQEALKQGIVAEINVVEKKDLAQERQKLDEKAKSDIEQARLRLVEEKNSYQRTIRQGNTDLKQAQLRLKEQQRNSQSLTNSGKLAILKSQEQLKNIEREITASKTEISQNKTHIDSLKVQLEQRVLKAPVNGVIFQLPIQHPGSVVQSGKMIAEIAPANSPLVIRANMATNQSSSLQKGLPVKVKFDAYPFQDYGVVEGKLAEISPTTTEVNTLNGKVEAYKLEIILNQNCISTHNKCIPLRPGDTATAEVIVRQRRIIDFILDPFKQLQNGGFKL